MVQWEHFLIFYILSLPNTSPTWNALASSAGRSLSHAQIRFYVIIANPACLRLMINIGYGAVPVALVGQNARLNETLVPLGIRKSGKPDVRHRAYHEEKR